METASSAEEFAAAAEEIDLYLEAAGCVQLNIAHKTSIVSKCVQFFLEGRVKEELERYKLDTA